MGKHTVQECVLSLLGQLSRFLKCQRCVQQVQHGPLTSVDILIYTFSSVPCQFIFSTASVSAPYILLFRFQNEPEEGSAVCSVESENKLEYANAAVKTWASIQQPPDNKTVSFPRGLILVWLYKGSLVKGCGKSLGGVFFFTFHPGIIPKPPCLSLLQTGSIEA